MKELKDIEQKIKDIVKITELCPTPLQEKCFEMLFNAYILNMVKPPNNAETVVPKEDKPNDDTETGKTNPPEKKTDEPEIKVSDIHVKARKFLEKGITIEQINNIFYKEGDEYKPLFDHLKTTKISESQIRITLLEALKNGLKNGEFVADTKVVRELCEVYKCYDSKNFSANFKASSSLFTDAYEKGGSLSLSVDGKDKLIEVIKDLAA